MTKPQTDLALLLTTQRYDALLREAELDRNWRRAHKTSASPKKGTLFMRKLAPTLFALTALALSACGTTFSDAPGDADPIPTALISDADLAAAPIESGGHTVDLALREIAPVPNGPETTLVAANEPTLSTQDVLPDVGGYVVYVKQYMNTGYWSITRANQATDQKTDLFISIYYPTSVSISGNGNKTYFTVDSTDESGKKVNKLYRYVSTQNKLTELASGVGDVRNVSTSYDGGTVAWEEVRACGANLSCFKRVIVVRTYSGSSYTNKIVSLPSAPYAPSISGDGKKLAFLTKNGSTTNVMHLYLQTNDLQVVASTNQTWYNPSVSNNGKVAWIESASPAQNIRIKVKTLLNGNITNVSYPSLGLYSANITGDGTYLGFSGYKLNSTPEWEMRTMNINYNATALVDSGNIPKAFWQK